MLRWVIGFLIMAVLAAVLGFGLLATAAAAIAKIIFYIFLILFVIFADRCTLGAVREREAWLFGFLNLKA